MNIEQINRICTIAKWTFIISTLVLVCLWIAYILQ